MIKIKGDSMNKIITIILITVFFSTFVIAQAPNPNDEQTATIIQKIDNEERNTRQFITTELDKRQNEFLTQFTDRADYYEGSVNDMINSFLIKLGMLFSGVMFFSLALLNIIRNRTEKKKYQILKDSLKKDLLVELKKEHIEFPEKDILLAKDFTEKKIEEPKNDKKPKRKFFSRKKKQEQEIQFIAEKLEPPKPLNVIDKMKVNM